MPRIVLSQNTKEALDRSKECSVDHDWSVTISIACHVFQLEPFWQVEIKLDGRHLPGASDGISSLNGNLRPIKRSSTGVRYQFKTAGLRHLLQGFGSGGPN